ncbi:hypothetical protein Hanom_Chr10g00872101 [Helianthus anomalus]
MMVDARPLQLGEADELESGDEVESGDDDYREDTFTLDVEMGEAGPSGAVQGVGTHSDTLGVHLIMHNSRTINTGLIRVHWSKWLNEDGLPHLPIGPSQVKCFFINNCIWWLVWKGL